MKWRCTWCGKPHAENDPPCDNCGHNAFEKAVVREGEAEAESPAASSDASVDTGVTETETVDTGTTYVWRCQDCGRDHVKYNPPCSRCGNHDLEKVEQRYDDIDGELETSSWLEVAKPYTPILAVVLVVVALFATGTVSLSIIPGVGNPAPPDASGAGSEAAGIDLEATEGEVHDRLESQRDAERSYDGGLADYAEYYNRGTVAADYDDEPLDEPDRDDFNLDCGGRTIHYGSMSSLSIDEFADEGELAGGVVDVLDSQIVDRHTDSRFHAEGLDLHVVDGTVYVTYAVC